MLLEGAAVLEPEPEPEPEEVLEPEPEPDPDSVEEPEPELEPVEEASEPLVVVVMVVMVDAPVPLASVPVAYIFDQQDCRDDQETRSGTHGSSAAAIGVGASTGALAAGAGGGGRARARSRATSGGHITRLGAGALTTRASGGLGARTRARAGARARAACRYSGQRDDFFFSSLTRKMTPEGRTRAGCQGYLNNGGRVVIRAGLGGAVTDTVLIVLVLAQAGHVTGLAVQLGGLGVHIADAHLLSDHQMLAMARQQRERSITGDV